MQRKPCKQRWKYKTKDAAITELQNRIDSGEWIALRVLWREDHGLYQAVKRFNINLREEFLHMDKKS